MFSSSQVLPPLTESQEANRDWLLSSGTPHDNCTNNQALQAARGSTPSVTLSDRHQAPLCKGIRPLESKDIPSATKLLNNYLNQFHLKAVFDEKELEHWLLPRKEIMNTYVITVRGCLSSPRLISDVQNAEGEVTDLVGFYTLPSTIIGNQTYRTLKAAYSYYNVATTVPLADLVKDALIFAKQVQIWQERFLT